MASSPNPGTVLVTGAAQRLGRAIALHFASQGWHVAVHYHRSSADAAALVHEIESLGAEAVALNANLADVAELARLVRDCADRLAAPTCLVNNAACYEWDTLASMNGDSWNAHLDVNLRAPIFLTQAFAAALPAEASGNVINIIDQKVLNPDPDYFSYTIAKSALWAATKAMAQALAPSIRVNAVGPGPVFPSVQQDMATFEREWRATPLRKEVAPHEICAAIQFLLDTSSITGQMIAVDSGQHLAWRSEKAGG